MTPIDKTLLVLGGTSDIARGTALAFATRGRITQLGGTLCPKIGSRPALSWHGLAGLFLNSPAGRVLDWKAEDISPSARG
jgi:hypothetical protein